MRSLGIVPVNPATIIFRIRLSGPITPILGLITISSLVVIAKTSKIRGDPYHLRKMFSETKQLR